MRNFRNSGFTMVELTVSVALVAVLGMIVYNVVTYAERQARIQTEDVQNLILKYGAVKVLTRDISNAAPTFNYINLEDDNNLPFFVLANNEYCQNSACDRTFTLSIPAGQVRSKAFFMLGTTGFADEMLRFAIDPANVVEETTGIYMKMNAPASDPLNFTKSTTKPWSPWFKGRLMLLSSANLFYDCMSSSQTFSPTPSGTCPITCTPSGSCNYATTRPLKLLGVINNDETDMVFTPVTGRPTLLKTAYKICRPDQNMNCTVSHDFPNLTSTQDFYEKLPYLPGTDNLTSVMPVELIRYHLERPSPNSPDHQIVLMRSVAENVGGSLSFDRAHILMSGIQTIVFTRRNISNPTLEYKITKVRLQRSIK